MSIHIGATTADPDRGVGTVHLHALMPHAACKTSMPHANQVSD
jgi:hypothetical protein